MGTKDRKGSSAELGSGEITGLLFKQSVPAVTGLLALALCQGADAFFLGRWVGISGVAAVITVAPLIFLFAAVGRCLGSGGASVTSRATGVGEELSVQETVTILLMTCFLLSILLLMLSYLFHGHVLPLLAGSEELYHSSRRYLLHLLPGLPFLGLAILTNNLIRGVGSSRLAMLILLLPAMMNLVLDYLFIVCWGKGVAGAAQATAVSYLCSALMAARCMRLQFGYIHQLQIAQDCKVIGLLREVTSIGMATLVCQLLSLTYCRDEHAALQIR